MASAAKTLIFTAWANTQLQSRHQMISSLSNLDDGVKFIALLQSAFGDDEVIFNKWSHLISRYHAEPIDTRQKLQNLQSIVSFVDALAKDAQLTHGVKPNDILLHKQGTIEEAIWIIIVRKILVSDKLYTSGVEQFKTACLQWVKSRVGNGILVQDFTSSWSDGVALLGLVQSLESELTGVESDDMSTLRSVKDSDKLLNGIFNFLLQNYAVPHIMSATELIICSEAGDEQPLLIYICLIRIQFEKRAALAPRDVQHGAQAVSENLSTIDDLSTLDDLSALDELDEVFSADFDAGPLRAGDTGSSLMGESDLSNASHRSNTKYLDLIVNHDAREFWASRIGKKRLRMDEFWAALQSWLLEDVSVSKCRTLADQIRKVLNKEAHDFVSYSDFNAFSTGIKPFTAVNLSDEMGRAKGRASRIDSVRAPGSHQLSDMSPRSLQSDAERARARRREMRESRYLSLIVNEQARDFWKHFVSTKVVKMDHLVHVLCEWLRKATLEDEICAGAGSAFKKRFAGKDEISYSDFNMVTLEIVPFEPTELCKILNVSGKSAKVSVAKASTSDAAAGTMTLRIVSCANLTPADRNGLSDPFITLRLLDSEGRAIAEKKTEVHHETLSPVFDQEFIFAVTSNDIPNLLITVWDYDKRGGDDYLGEVCSDLALHFHGWRSGITAFELHLEDPRTEINPKHLRRRKENAASSQYGSVLMNIIFTANAIDDDTKLAHLDELVDKEDDLPVVSGNEESRKFWDRYVGEDKILLDDFVETIEAWLLKDGVKSKECDEVRRRMLLQMRSGDENCISFVEFDLLTTSITPFTPAKFCDQIMRPPDIESQPSSKTFLDFFADDAARDFWIRYMGGEKKIKVDEGMEMVEGWFLKDGISLGDCDRLLPKCRKILDRAHSGFITYSAFNKFSLAIKPFTAKQAHHWLLAGDAKPDPNSTSSPQPPPGAPRPAYLELIINQHARDFWYQFVADMRSATSQVTGAFDAWLLKEGVTKEERAIVIPMATEQLDVEHTGFVTYAEFNTFTLEMTPFIATRICEVIKMKSKPSSIHPVAAPSPTARVEAAAPVPTQAPVVEDVSDPDEPVWVKLIANEGAREFWMKYVGDKRVLTVDLLDTLEAWLRGDGISRANCRLILDRAETIMDHKHAGEVSYSAWNTFTMDVIPFCQERLKDVCGQPTLEPSASPKVHGVAMLLSLAVAGDMRLDVDHIAGFAIGDTIIIDDVARSIKESNVIIRFGSMMLQSPISATFGVGSIVTKQVTPDLDPEPESESEPEPELEPEPEPEPVSEPLVQGPEPEPEPEPTDGPDMTKMVVFLRTAQQVAAHVVPGSRWWQEMVNNVVIPRQSQVHQEIHVLTEQNVLDVMRMDSANPEVGKAAMRSMLRALNFSSGVPATATILDGFTNQSSAKLNALEVACSLLFLCKINMVQLTDGIFKVVGSEQDDLLTLPNFTTWVKSLSKVTRMCAVGSCNMFNGLCGGRFEPNRDKKQGEFSKVVMNAARQRMQTFETQLISRFQTNLAQAPGMRSKLFQTWMAQQKPIKRWLVGLSEEWRNLLDHKVVLHLPELVQTGEIGTLVSLFDFVKTSGKIPTVRLAEQFLRFGIKDEAIIALLTKLLDADMTGKASVRDVLSGLSLACGDPTEVKLQLLFKINKFDKDLLNVTAQDIYKAMRSYTMITVHIATLLMNNCSIFETDRKLQDVLTRIINVRVSVYFNYVSVLIAGYIQDTAGVQALDYKDMRRYLDKETGLTNWYSSVGMRFAFEIGVFKLVEQMTIEEAKEALTGAGKKVRSLKIGPRPKQPRNYTIGGDNEPIVCMQDNSVWSKNLLFCGTIIPRSNKRPPSGFDSLKLSDANVFVKDASISQHQLDHFVHSLGFQDHGIAENLFHIYARLSQEQPLALSALLVSLRKVNSKEKLADVWDTLKDDSQFVPWTRIKVWLENIIYINEDAVKRVCVRLHELCHGPDEEHDEHDPLLRDMMITARRFAKNAMDRMRIAFGEQMKQQSMGAVGNSAAGLGQREFVLWLATKKGLMKAVDTWLQTTLIAWLHHVCELEYCCQVEQKVLTPMLRRKAAKLSEQWTGLGIQAIHAAFGVTNATPKGRVDTNMLHTALEKLRFSQIVIERFLLIFDTESTGSVDVRDILANLYLLSDHPDEGEKVDRILELFEVGADASSITQDMYAFLRPFILTAVDAAEGLSTSIADMTGRDHTTKHIIMRRTNDNLCIYADMVVSGTNSFLKLNGEVATSSLRRFLEDKFSFVAWATDVGSEWILHAEKFIELKPGMVLRKELVSFVKYANQYETVADGSWWWSQIVTNNKHHSRLRSLHCENYPGSHFKDIKIDVDSLCYVKVDCQGVSVEVEDLIDAMRTGNIENVDNVRAIHATFDAGDGNIDIKELGCGLLMLGNGSIESKITRAISFLHDDATGKVIEEDVEKMINVLLAVSRHVTLQLGNVVENICGKDYEPQFESKREQFSSLTLTESHKQIASLIETILPRLKQAAEQDSVPSKVLAQLLLSHPHYKVLWVRMAAWWRYCILSESVPTHEISSVLTVSQMLRRFSIGNIRPVIEKYLRFHRTGRSLVIELCKALGLTATMREVMFSLLCTSDDGETVDVKECGVVFAIICGADDARAKMEYALELFDLTTLKSAGDQHLLAFNTQSYGMLRPMWMVAMHTISALLRTYHNNIQSAGKTISALVQIISMRLGLYLETIAQVLKSPECELHGHDWQTHLDAETGHIAWLSRLSTAFVDSLAGIVDPELRATEKAQAETQVKTQRAHAKAAAAAAAAQKEATAAERQASAAADAAAAAAAAAAEVAAAQPQVEPEPESAVAPAATPTRVPPPSLPEGILQKGKKMKERYYALHEVPEQGMCLCKYENAQEAAARCPKAPLPLYCVKKVHRLQPDVTEFVTVVGQTNRFKLLHHGGGKVSDVEELRTDTSAVAMVWMAALERYLAPISGVLEMPKESKKTDPNLAPDNKTKWLPRFFVLQRTRLLWFDGPDASSLSPLGGPVTPAQYRVVGRFGAASEWTEFGAAAVEVSDAAYIELRLEKGGRVLRLRDPGQGLARWLLALRRAQVLAKRAS
eukprot:SAG11_NODE_36_length_21869_cov_38.038999_11_plen_3076_part_00